MEIEVSLWSYEEETRKGALSHLLDLIYGLVSYFRKVIATAEELGVAVVAYS